MKVPVIVFVLALIPFAFGLWNSRKNVEYEMVGDAGDPLILTPYIENNQTDLGRQLAIVNNPEIFNSVLSYSGYFTVDERYNSNMFFWFFPSESNVKNDPVLLWLNGGPGSSSLFGLFSENGPFYADETGNLIMRNYSWHKSHSVIYIDNPTGVGYSFVNSDGYSQNETKVGEDLYNALQQFFTLFPELRANEFYITGESYAGKYLPALGSTILNKSRETNDPEINLKGISIGNGLCDPLNQLKYGDYLYELGLIDINTLDVFRSYEFNGAKAIEAEDYDSAFNIFDVLINGDLTPYPTIFKNETGFDNYFNYLYTVDNTIEIENNYRSFIVREDVRRAIHVGNAVYGDDGSVEKNLRMDIMQSVAPWISELLSNYRMLFYNGQLDIIVAYPLTMNFLQNLDFSSSTEYENAKRSIWFVDDEVAGYSKVAGNLTEVLVRDAGHMVPFDQPKWAYELIHKFTRNQRL